jgi:hypothetical protein
MQPQFRTGHQQLSPQYEPIIQGNARVFACVKGKLMVQVGNSPAVIRICGNIAPVFLHSTYFMEPVECEVKLFSWYAKDNTFYGDVAPVMEHLTPKKTARRRLRSI